MKTALSAVYSGDFEWFVFIGSSIMFNGSVLNPSTNESHVVSGRSHRVYGTVGGTVIILLTGCISMLTVLGNVLVLLSIKVNRNLRTINNYFLFSLACADLIVGVFSLNLYTVYIVKGYWPLGPQMCDLWLVVDYVVSNASAMNLLVICFDRYFCVTRPLSYPARRTAGWALAMISAAWLLSFLLWAPAILFWQIGRDGRKVPEGECYILLLANPAVTLATAIPAFYLPVVIMTVLYIRISLASQRRVFKKTLESTNLLQPNGGASIKPDIVNDIKRDQTCSFKDDLIRKSKLRNSVDSSPDASVAERGLDTKPNTIMDSTEVSNKILCSNSSVFKSNSCLHRTASKVLKDVSKLTRRKAVRERKVTRTIFAVLLAFICTWTPHNVMVLIATFCHWCVPEVLWVVGYFLCYINSTVNPMCYALCNDTFKRTFKRLLKCRFRNQRLR
ncbi:Muscarinic acetylcholine receptor M4 [Triplophysa tibetana]|uniref:Muscarinic acetylcholine receptor n=1 Tax=Triplophysa tibetana TaxID=1572043 RepID=A0A5A9PQZ1_9TELE|nr:Muscarinic acetylcholine receptor M4 [Triplophysa tibetana]